MQVPKTQGLKLGGARDMLPLKKFAIWLVCTLLLMDNVHLPEVENLQVKHKLA